MEPAIPAMVWRGWLSFTCLTGLWLLEQWKPFKPGRDPKLRRWARNLLLTVSNALILEILLGGAIVAYIAWLSSHRIGLLHAFGVHPVTNILLSIVFLDFATYLWHMAYHEVPAMWRLHRAHHSDRDLDVTSASRFHLGEILLSAVYRMGVAALWGPSVPAMAVFEASLLAFAQMEHSNIRLPGDWDSRLRTVLVTPDMHRVHHSVVRAQTNSNYSTIFSWWDRMFGTYIVEGVSQEGITIGLPEYSRAEDVTLGRVLAIPFDPPCPSTIEISDQKSDIGESVELL